MSNGWMIRAGEQGRLFDEFEKNNVVAIGWGRLGSIKNYKTQDEIYSKYEKTFDASKPSRTANAAAIIYKFYNAIKQGDTLISYSPERREYLIGEDLGEYLYQENLVTDYPNLRKVKWLGYVKRDLLKTSTKNSLGSTLTMFSLNDDVIKELRAAINQQESSPVIVAMPDELDDLTRLKDDTVERSLELIKDKINHLDPEEMEQLVAAILRGMGFKTKVSPKGSDRNVDIFASPDGLGLETPRIKVEVKHRNGQMGAKEIRSFIGALREGDRGLFVSTGGYSKDARYEAERANISVTLLTLDDLAHLIVDNYDSFDTEGRALIPLVRIYWPAA